MDLIDPNRDILQNEISIAPDCYEGPRVYSTFLFVEEFESLKQLHQEITNSLEITDLNLMNDLEEFQILISDLDKESINRALENYFQKSKRGSNLLGNYSKGLPLNLGLRSIPARKFEAWVSEIFEVHKGLVKEGGSLRIQRAPLMVRAYEFLNPSLHKTIEDVVKHLDLDSELRNVKDNKMESVLIPLLSQKIIDEYL